MKKKEKNPGHVVRRAVSLPQKIDEEVRYVVRTEGRSYSGVVREALAGLLSQRKEHAMEEVYAKYYAGADVRRNSEELAANLFRTAGAQWPAYEEKPDS